MGFLEVIYINLPGTYHLGGRFCNVQKAELTRISTLMLQNLPFWKGYIILLLYIIKRKKVDRYGMENRSWDS